MRWRARKACSAQPARTRTAVRRGRARRTCVRRSTYSPRPLRCRRRRCSLSGAPRPPAHQFPRGMLLCRTSPGSCVLPWPNSLPSLPTYRSATLGLCLLLAQTAQRLCTGALEGRHMPLKARAKADMACALLRHAALPTDPLSQLRYGLGHHVACLAGAAAAATAMPPPPTRQLRCARAQAAASGRRLQARPTQGQVRAAHQLWHWGTLSMVPSFAAPCIKDGSVVVVGPPAPCSSQ